MSIMEDGLASPPGPPGNGGFTLIESLIGTVLLAITFLAVAGVFGSNISSIDAAKRTTRGALFADEIMNSLNAQSSSALLAMNGNTFYDNAKTERARFRAVLTVEQTTATLLTVRLDLYGLRSNEASLQLLTYRRVQ